MILHDCPDELYGEVIVVDGGCPSNSAVISTSPALIDLKEFLKECSEALNVAADRVVDEDSGARLTNVRQLRSRKRCIVLQKDATWPPVNTQPDVSPKGLHADDDLSLSSFSLEDADPTPSASTSLASPYTLSQARRSRPKRRKPAQAPGAALLLDEERINLVRGATAAPAAPSLGSFYAGSHKLICWVASLQTLLLACLLVWLLPHLAGFNGSGGGWDNWAMLASVNPLASPQPPNPQPGGSVPWHVGQTRTEGLHAHVASSSGQQSPEGERSHIGHPGNWMRKELEQQRSVVAPAEPANLKQLQTSPDTSPVNKGHAVIQPVRHAFPEKEHEVGVIAAGRQPAVTSSVPTRELGAHPVADDPQGQGSLGPRDEPPPVSWSAGAAGAVGFPQTAQGRDRTAQDGGNSGAACLAAGDDTTTQPADAHDASGQTLATSLPTSDRPRCPETGPQAVVPNSANVTPPIPPASSPRSPACPSSQGCNSSQDNAPPQGNQLPRNQSPQSDQSAQGARSPSAVPAAAAAGQPESPPAPTGQSVPLRGSDETGRHNSHQAAGNNNNSNDNDSRDVGCKGANSVMLPPTASASPGASLSLSTASSSSSEAPVPSAPVRVLVEHGRHQWARDNMFGWAVLKTAIRKLGLVDVTREAGGDDNQGWDVLLCLTEECSGVDSWRWPESYGTLRPHQFMPDTYLLTESMDVLKTLIPPSTPGPTLSPEAPAYTKALTPGSGSSKNSRKQGQAALEQGDGGKIWVVKNYTASGLAYGEDKFLITSQADLPKAGPWLVQQYISNPYLLYGRKFALRLYLMLTSIQPLRLYMFHDGIVSVAVEPFSLSADSLRSPRAHFPNEALAAYHDAHRPPPPAREDVRVGGGPQRRRAEAAAARDEHRAWKCVWTWLELQGALAKEGHDLERLQRQLEDMAIKVVISAEHFPCYSYLLLFICCSRAPMLLLLRSTSWHATRSNSCAAVTRCSSCWRWTCFWTPNCIRGWWTCPMRCPACRRTARPSMTSKRACSWTCSFSRVRCHTTRLPTRATWSAD
eukprot:jgi/Mesvir1/489/Mv11360-RA.2